MGIPFKNREKLDELINLLVVFINIQEEPNLWFVLHYGAIAFISFYNEPFAFSYGSIAYFSLLDKTRKPCTRDNTR